MKKLIICFDIDNVICKSPTNLYSKSTPYKKNIEVINLLKKEVTISKFLLQGLWEEIKKTQCWQKNKV